MSALAFFKVYKRRFKTSWDLFKRVFCGLFLGTLLSVAFVYAFRVKWEAFPTSVFALSFFINLLLIFKVNQLILKYKKRIKKKVVVIGENGVDDIVIRKADIERHGIDEIEELIEKEALDEIVICEEIRDDKVLSLLIYLIQRSKIDVIFAPSIYMKLLPGKIDGKNSVRFLSTFIGRKPDVEEFLMRSLDVAGSMLLLLICVPVMIIISLLIRASSTGPVLYKQQRVGKDGRTFTLYKFRTMVKDAEKMVGPTWASRDDPRVTKAGRILRATRLDELPQLFNVLMGDMSLVGPRPERPHFVKLHRALRELRLAVKPGITGLAQVRSFYDLKPRHKVKYDYLYIQQRSFLLNLYILAKTIPVLFSKKGW
ncbi:MAG TPA: exopolysaccharide biosynthesis polyprenyl glycosylphosphotransferase [Sedimentisphaerales bacterium]|nr:exopolysaccharide biosynthesis polyprenyl glycosylphosphotransferase [Sedimentisphaerales bacterium]